MRGLTCPWCGRAVRLLKDGTLPVHKSNERTFLGNVRLYCLGEHRDPYALTHAERIELRKTWRDSDGWLRMCSS